jgi:hypothetical protein
VDANNPAVKLCSAGMQAEGEGRHADAKALFEQAWHESRDDYEACIAAHYVARHQPTVAEEFEWNRLALERAERVDDDRVSGFFPSLHLNLAHSFEKLGRLDEARDYYGRAAAGLHLLGESPYARLVRTGVMAGQARTSTESTT